MDQLCGVGDMLGETPYFAWGDVHKYDCTILPPSILLSSFIFSYSLVFKKTKQVELFGSPAQGQEQSQCLKSLHLRCCLSHGGLSKKDRTVQFPGRAIWNS